MMTAPGVTALSEVARDKCSALPLSSLGGTGSSCSDFANCTRCASNHATTSVFKMRVSAQQLEARLHGKSPWTVRRRAAKELGKLGIASASRVAALRAAMERDWNSEVRAAAREALAALESTNARQTKHTEKAGLHFCDSEEVEVDDGASTMTGGPQSKGMLTRTPSLLSLTTQSPPSTMPPSPQRTLSTFSAMDARSAPTVPPSPSEASTFDPHEVNSAHQKTEAQTFPQTALVGARKKDGSKARKPQPGRFDGRRDESGQLLPQYWGVKVRDLVAFHDEIMDQANPENLESYCKCHQYFFEDSCCTHVCLRDSCSHDHRGIPHVPLSEAPQGITLVDMVPNMHMVVAREIKPRTLGHGCSFALMTKPNGRKIDAFITHTWNERFSNFVGTLRMALDLDDVVWVCSFALDQNADIKDLLDTDDLTKTPFAVALQRASKLLVIVDEELTVPERCWCTYEIEMAHQWGIPTFVWPYELSNLYALQEKVQHLDVRHMTAHDPIDMQRIHDAIQKGSGYDEMNTRLRQFLGDRLRFYQAAVCKHQEQLLLVAEQIKIARAVNDMVRVEALLREQRDQFRLMQEESMRQEAVEEQTQLRQKLTEAEHRIEVGNAELAEQRDAALEAVRRLELQLDAATNTPSAKTASTCPPASTSNTSSPAPPQRQALPMLLGRKVSIAAPDKKVLRPAWMVQQHSFVTVKPVWAAL